MKRTCSALLINSSKPAKAAQKCTLKWSLPDYNEYSIEADEMIVSVIAVEILPGWWKLLDWCLQGSGDGWGLHLLWCCGDPSCKCAAFSGVNALTGSCASVTLQQASLDKNTPAQTHVNFVPVWSFFFSVTCDEGQHWHSLRLIFHQDAQRSQIQI